MSHNPNPQPDESVASAARALADATAALTRLLGQQMSAVSDDVGRAVSVGLREASKGLDVASEQVAKAGTASKQAADAASRRRERTEQTRGELLDATARVVADRGYEGASVGWIAAEAGFTKGAVYANFGSKEEMFVALAERERTHGRLLPATALDRTGNPCAGPSPTDGPQDTTPSSSGTSGTDCLQTSLLAYEVLAYAARSGHSRAELRPVLREDLDRLATLARDARVARVSGGSPVDSSGPPDVLPQDRDTAAGVLAATLLGALLDAVDHDSDARTAVDAGGPPVAVTGLAERLAGRLLG